MRLIFLNNRNEPPTSVIYISSLDCANKIELSNTENPRNDALIRFDGTYEQAIKEGKIIYEKESGEVIAYDAADEKWHVKSATTSNDPAIKLDMDVSWPKTDKTVCLGNGMVNSYERKNEENVFEHVAKSRQVQKAMSSLTKVDEGLPQGKSRDPEIRCLY